MPRKRIIIIPKGLRCKQCGSGDLRGAGKEWKVNPDGDNPPKIKIQKYKCAKCGYIFLDSGG
jgi:DNA-directed RNA polymerase subunit RPC12/RpoP